VGLLRMFRAASPLKGAEVQAFLPPSPKGLGYVKFNWSIALKGA